MPQIQTAKAQTLSRSKLLPSSGNFATCPIPEAPPELDHALAVEIDAGQLSTFLHALAAGKEELAFANGGPGVHPQRLLIDLDGIDDRGLTPEILQNDARVLADILHNNAEAVVQLVRSRQDLEASDAIAREIGFTEENFVNQGGGFIWIIAAAAVVVLASGCATTKPFRKEEDDPAEPLIPG